MNVAIIGGGPAGMTAAVEAARIGHSVTIYEKNQKLGKKLYITGKGRCNLTNDCDNTTFLQNVVNNSRFLYSAIAAFSASDTIRRFEDWGVPLKVERGQRVFPQSDRAVDVTIAFEKELKRLNVGILFDCDLSMVEHNGETFSLTFRNGKKVVCDALILACGGASYPATGSTGDGYNIARKLGHTIVEPKTALAPILFDTICGKPRVDLPSLEGLALKNVNLSLKVGKKTIFDQQGEMLFTSNGISGPLVLTLSSLINRIDLCGRSLMLDLKPALSIDELDARLLREFEGQKKLLRNSLDHLLPQKIIPFVVAALPAEYDKEVGKLSREQRHTIASLLKGIVIDGLSLSPIEVGIVTSGGVNVKEINPSTMESKIVKNLYFAGEMLDVDAYTGGFNMQIALSTGFVAGKSIKEEENL